jgi:hypothetical protein
MNELIICYVSVKVLLQQICLFGQSLAHSFNADNILAILYVVNDKYKTKIVLRPIRQLKNTANLCVKTKYEYIIYYV